MIILKKVFQCYSTIFPEQWNRHLSPVCGDNLTVLSPVQWLDADQARWVDVVRPTRHVLEDDLEKNIIGIF